MASFLDYGAVLAPLAINHILQRRAAGNASKTLQTGVDAASTRIARTGADLKDLYAPYEKLGTDNIDALNAGVKPGGGLADPYTKEFNFTGADLENSPGYQFELAEGQKAIDAARKSMGTRLSGGAVKQAIRYGTDYAGTKFQQGFNNAKTTFDTNENVFRQNQTDRYNRLMGVVDAGRAATSSDAASRLITGQQLAELETEKANAIAAGDVAKANEISKAIEAGVGAVSDLKTIDAIKKIGKPAAALTGADFAPAASVPLVAGTSIGASTSLAGTAGAGFAGAGSAGAATGLAPTVPAIGSVAPAGTASAAVPAGTTGGGVGSAVTGLLSNPITIAAGLGIVAAISWVKSQAHHEANSWVKDFQNPFDQKAAQIHDQFFSLAQSGKLDKQSALAMRDGIQQLFTEYEAQRQKLAMRGKDEKRVADQAGATFSAAYGEKGSKWLNEIDQIIARLG